MRRLAVLLDFDGTLTETDIGTQVIRRFGAHGWERGIERYRAGAIGVRELLEWETSHLQRSALADMLRFAVGAATIRPGLRELIDFANARDIPIEVVSNGWDFYIREVLHRNGFSDLEFCSPVARFGAGDLAELRFGETIEVCQTTGLCKCERVRRHMRAGRLTLYAGDGISDFCVAAEADVVLARRELAAHCEREGIEYVAYEDMFDVLAELRRRARDGREAAPPTAQPLGIDGSAR